MLAQGAAPGAFDRDHRMRYLGIDFGEKRIGVAVSDEHASFALPVGTVERRSDHQAIGELAEMARERDIGGLVVGRPTRSDGRAGDLEPRIEKFAERLARACGLPLHFADEALTSVEARRQSQHTAGRRGDPVDSLAARLLLQGWLDQERQS